jgi:hypothetical protein
MAMKAKAMPAKAMGGKGKPGPSSVDQASKGSNPVHNSGGGPGKSSPQVGIPGPKTTGGPSSLKKALAKKPASSRGL